MEALIVSPFALFAIVLLRAGYWIAIAIARWAPVIAAGALAGWLAGRYRAQTLEALGLGVLVCARQCLAAPLAPRMLRRGLAMRRARWATREERDRVREEMAEAGGVSAWIRTGSSEQARAEQRRRMSVMNALAERLGHARPYPELDDD